MAKKQHENRGNVWEFFSDRRLLFHTSLRSHVMCLVVSAPHAWQHFFITAHKKTFFFLHCW